MLRFIKNHFYRMLSKKNYIIVALVMTLGATTFAPCVRPLLFSMVD